MEYKARHDWVGKENVQEISIRPYQQMVYAQPGTCPRKLLWDFNIQMDHLIPARRPDLIIITKKNENLQNCQFCCPGRPQNKTERMWKEG